MYHVIVKHPTNMTNTNNIAVIHKTTEEYENKSLAEVAELYNDFERSGYDIGVKMDTKEVDIDPFYTADLLDNAGVTYTATLKLKNKGTYEEAQAIARIVESHGFDFDVTATLRIKDDSTVNFDRETTWFSPNDAFYTVKPKIKSSNIGELRSVFDNLSNTTGEASIELKVKKTDEYDIYNELAAYPEGTVVVFTLKDSEY